MGTPLNILANTRLIPAALLCIALLFAPPAGAQATKLSRVGVLWLGDSPIPRSRLDWLRSGLREYGYAERQNMTFELRHGDTADRLRAGAKELVNSPVDVIVTAGELAAVIAQQSTSATAIVALAPDHVRAGLAASLARPDRNVTGVAILGAELSAKRVALLKEIMPALSRVAILWYPGDLTDLEIIKDTARSLSITLQLVEVRNRGDLPRAFEALKDGRAEALTVLPSPLLFSFHPPIVDMAAKQRLPAIYQWREAAEVGGLASYGPSLSGMWQQTGRMAAKILKGAKPANLPIEQAAQFELVINLRTAKALGVTVPERTLIRADRVIE
jgi:putative tryptophan/tyrosine transport system substrate-binding protein